MQDEILITLFFLGSLQHIIYDYLLSSKVNNCEVTKLINRKVFQLKQIHAYVKIMDVILKCRIHIILKSRSNSSEILVK